MERLGKLIGIIKYLLLVFLIVFVASLLSTGKTSKAKIDTVASKVTKAADMEKLTLADNRMLKRFYGLNANDYADVVLYAAGSNMEVEEILIVKLKDVNQGEAVEAAIQARLDSQISVFEGYGPEQCKMLESSIIDVQGNYVLYVVNAKAKAVDKAFQKSL